NADLTAAPGLRDGARHGPTRCRAAARVDVVATSRNPGSRGLRVGQRAAGRQSYKKLEEQPAPVHYKPPLLWSDGWSGWCSICRVTPNLVVTERNDRTTRGGVESSLVVGYDHIADGDRRSGAAGHDSIRSVIGC